MNVVAFVLVKVVDMISDTQALVEDDSHRLLLTRDWEDEEDDSGLEPDEPADL